MPEAIRFYTQAKRYSHGVRLAKRYELDSELMNLALKVRETIYTQVYVWLGSKRDKGV